MCWCQRCASVDVNDMLSSILCKLPSHFGGGSGSGQSASPTTGTNYNINNFLYSLWRKNTKNTEQNIEIWSERYAYEYMNVCLYIYISNIHTHTHTYTVIMSLDLFIL